MLLHINRMLLTALFCLIQLTLDGQNNFINAEEIYPQPDLIQFTKTTGSKGYRDVVHFKDKYFAVGTEGRIDSFTKTGERVNVEDSNKYTLNCAFSNSEILIAAGDHGTILYSNDGKNFIREESGIDENINGITYAKGMILACADKGKILISANGKKWNIIQTSAEGNIMSLSAR